MILRIIFHNPTKTSYRGFEGLAGTDTDEMTDLLNMKDGCHPLTCEVPSWNLTVFIVNFATLTKLKKQKQKKHI